MPNYTRHPISSTCQHRASLSGKFYRSSDRGFSLIAVAALGAVVMTWLFAMSAAVVPMYQRASQGRYFTVVRSSAEAGLDYAVATLNQALQAGVPAPIDDGSRDGAPVSSTVPAAAIGNSGAQVTIQVNNIDPANASSIYDAQWDPEVTGALNSWRVVTATASYAGLQKSIRVILKPEPAASLPSQTRVPYFQFAMFGKASITLGQNARTDGYDSRNGAYGLLNNDPYGGDVGSNSQAALSGSADIGGDLRVYSNPPGSTTNVVASTTSSNVVVRDQLVTNGISSGFTATNGPTAFPPPVGSDNVLAGGDGTPGDRSGDWTTPIDSSQSLPQMEVPPAKTVPSDKQVVTGGVTWTGDSGWATQPGQYQVADLGSISVSSDRVLNIRPGDYKISSLSVAGNASIVIRPNVDGSFGPVRFFVEGIAPGDNVIQIAGNGITNQSNIPSNLQFWYNGPKNILLAGNGDMHTVVYAPNSSVSVSGNGTYYGSLLGKTVTNTGNGAVHFDKALLQTSTSAQISFAPNQSQAAPAALKTRSWQEL